MILRYVVFGYRGKLLDTFISRLQLIILIIIIIMSNF